jgi:DNA polymerase III delta subunit
MIYIFYGNDRLKKKTQIKKFATGTVVDISLRDLNESILLSYAENVSLFGEKNTIVLEDAINEKEEIFTNNLLSKMKESQTVFILLEDSLLAPQKKKYKPFCEEMEEFEANLPKATKSNPFLLADLFFKRDRLGAWLTYNRQIESGESAEAIAGMLFWRIKKAILNKEHSTFKENELRSISTRIMNDYHRAHNGECDLSIAIESCILSVL